MGNKKNLMIIVAICFLSANWIYAQTGRYNMEVFNDVKITKNVKYAENYSFLTTENGVLENLLMDIYEPVGDTANGPYEDTLGRPLIILTHAGSFLPTDFALPFGSKNDSCWIEMCSQFAKRGWVAVAMNYRIGWNPLSSDPTVRTGTIINAVYRAMQDLKACVRYFRKNAAMYNIDPYRVAVGGSNSGGYVSLALGALNKESEIKLAKFRNPETGESVINQAVTGGFYGEGGCVGKNAPLNNPGYSSEAQVILNMGGAIGDTTWQEAGEPPIVAFHGEADPLTPYKTATVIVSATGDPVVEVSGSHDLIRRAVNLGNQDIFSNQGFNDAYTMVAESRTPYEGLMPFPGQLNGYEPWAWYDSSLTQIIDAGNPSDNFPPPYSGFGGPANPYATRAKAEGYIDTIMSYFTPRALAAFDAVDRQTPMTADPDDAPTAECPSVGILSHKLYDIALGVFPNPSEGDINIKLYDAGKELESVRLLNVTGKEVMLELASDRQELTIKRGNLKPGVYFANIKLVSGEVVTRRVILK